MNIEQEDERIINAIKQMYSFIPNKPEYIGTVAWKDIFAWLEKQSVENMIKNDAIQLCNELTETIVALNDEQKPAWSEEDELHIRELESLVKQVWATAEHKNDKDTIHKMSELSFFLKTLKPQPKQEWNEEDEKNLNEVQRILELHGQCSMGLILWLKSLKDRVLSQLQSDERNRLLGKLEEWLDEYISNLADVDTATLICSFTNYLDGKLSKPIRPQNTWKPSDEQMEAIESAVKSYPHVGTRKQVVLLELLEQLKTL